MYLDALLILGFFVAAALAGAFAALFNIRRGEPFGRSFDYAGAFSIFIAFIYVLPWFFMGWSDAKWDPIFVVLFVILFAVVAFLAIGPGLIGAAIMHCVWNWVRYYRMRE